MRKACEELLDKRLPVPGLAVCCFRLPDGRVTQRGYNRWLNPPQVQQAFLELVRGFESLKQQQLPATQMVWVFEHLRVMLRLRPDQGCLALFLENRPELPLSDVQEVLNEFAELGAAGID